MRTSGRGGACRRFRTTQEVLVPHANAPLTELGRLRLARCVVDDGWPLRRAGAARLAHLDRGTAEPIRRYEHAAPGDLVHVDIKKLGNIPDGGGHKVHGRATGRRHSSAHRDPTRPRKVSNHPNLGYGYLHNAVDDHSRLAYTEILPDETKESAVAFWQRAHAFFTTAGITVTRVLTDNGSCYRSKLWRDTL